MITCQQADLSAIETLLEWATSEGWNPGLDDAAVFHEADPGGFYIALDNHKPVAGVSVVRQGRTQSKEPFGFLGLYLCVPDYRGRGIGMQIWNHALERCACSVIGLDGVVAQQDNYRLSGFEFAWRNIRYVGAPNPALANDCHPVSNAILIEPYCETDSDSILKLDSHYSGVSRQQYLRPWVRPSSHRQTWVAKLHSAGSVNKLAGFVTIRRCHSGYKVGPLIAEDESVATTLLQKIMARYPGEGITVDVPEPNSAAIGLVESLGLQSVFETARMYKGLAPTTDLSRYFGVASLELG